MSGSFGLGSKRGQVERVGSFDGHAKGSGPHLGGHDSEGARNTKHHSVVVVLGQTVVHQEGARAAVNVGPRVLDLASGVEALGNLLVVGLDKIDEVVVLDVSLSKVKLTDESRIGLTQDSMTIARDDFSGFEGVVDVLGNVSLGPVISELFLELQDEVEALLVSKTVEGTSESVHTSREGEVRVRKG